MPSKIKIFGPYVLLGFLFVTAILFRPVLPIDETRYLTVAWEMFLQKQYAVLTLNFHPYHHKPPMLFWMINAVWEIFGVNRSIALIPVFAASALVMFLTRKLAQTLLPGEPSVAQAVPWLFIGSVPFLIYNTLMMFDIMLTAFVLAVLLVFAEYARNPVYYKPLIGGIIMGLGVLVKGPVMYLYVLWPLLLYVFWKDESMIRPKWVYLGVLGAVIVSVIPVMAWLIPALSQTGDEFAFWLVWNQTAGRVSGNFSSAHVRPFYFYLMLVPVLFLPWCFFPSCWRNIHQLTQSKLFRFLASATLPVFLSFCMIAGKQPHYLVPLLPFVILGFAVLLHDSARLMMISMVVVFLFFVGQAVASQTIFYRYDLGYIAQLYNEDNDTNWAYVRKYQGEVGFLAKIEKPIDSIESNKLKKWFRVHPDGKAIVRYHSLQDMHDYEALYTQKYKGKYIGVFQKKTGE